jgi:tetratricopeptide (TPR) repeat protein
MTTDHCRDDALLAYQFGACANDEERAIREHLMACPGCRERFDEIGRDIEEVTQPSSVPPRAAALSPDVRKLGEFVDVANRMTLEQAEGEAFLDEAQAVEPEALAGLLILQPATVGLVRVLVTRARDLLSQSPPDAVIVTAATAALADRLSTRTYPDSTVAQLRGRAWTEYANALRYVSRNEEAIAALDHADVAMRIVPAAAYDRAVASFVRAMVYRQLDAGDEAMALLRDAASVFRDHGDERRFIDCGVVEGAILYRAGRLDAARDRFRATLTAAESLRDFETMARLHNNLGHCAADAGDVAAATTLFGRARDLFENLGLTTEIARAEWGSGRALATAGRYAAAVGCIEAARHKFEEAGMVSEAAFCGLEIVEALVRAGDTAAARTTLAQTLDRSRGARLGGNAIAALAYLSDRLDAPEALRHVHGFFESLQGDPNLTFALPA